MRTILLAALCLVPTAAHATPVTLLCRIWHEDGGKTITFDPATRKVYLEESDTRVSNTSISAHSIRWRENYPTGISYDAQLSRESGVLIMKAVAENPLVVRYRCAVAKRKF